MCSLKGKVLVSFLVSRMQNLPHAANTQHCSSQSRWRSMRDHSWVVLLARNAGASRFGFGFLEFSKRDLWEVAGIICPNVQSQSIPINVHNNTQTILSTLLQHYHFTFHQSGLCFRNVIRATTLKRCGPCPSNWYASKNIQFHIM